MKKKVLFTDWKNRHLKLLGRDNVTLIIGARCKDGVVIAGDRRVLRGTEYSEEKKISQPFKNFVVGASGISGLMDKFLYEMNHHLATTTEPLTWRDFLYFLENLANSLYNRYRAMLNEEEEVEIGPYMFEVLYGFKEYEDYASLYHLYRTGFSVEVKKYDVIGHGQPHALPFLKSLYHPDITMDEMIKLSTFILCLMDKEKIDLSVGGKPQIFKIPDGGDAEELTDEEIDALIDEIGDPKERLKKSIF